MKWFSFSLFLFLLLLTNCSKHPPLSGKITLPKDGNWSPTIYLIQPGNLDEVASSFTGQVLDSAVIQADGRFAFGKLPDAPNPILLELAVQQKGERFVNKLDNEDLVNANYFPIVYQNEGYLKITADIEQFQGSFSIKNPSPENAALLQLRDIRLKAFQQFLQQTEESNHDDTQLLEKEDALLNFRQPMMGFAQNTEHLLPALMALRWVSPNNDFERVPEFLVSQCQKWQNAHPAHPWVAQLCQKSNRQQLPVLKGDQLPDANLPMLSGDTTALYQLLGDRLTVLDLWASWCGPCRKENRDILVPLWEKYHQNGFQIVGYALDGGEKVWKKAIEKDGADRWVHASHLQGDDAPFLEVLRIQTIPANFLLDRDGTVVAKNLHGEELVRFVEEYLAN